VQDAGEGLVFLGDEAVTQQFQVHLTKAVAHAPVPAGMPAFYHSHVLADIAGAATETAQEVDGIPVLHRHQDLLGDARHDATIALHGAAQHDSGVGFMRGAPTHRG
jgi:hypothetical protein